LSELSSGHFADYRDERLLKVKPITLKREFSLLHNLFEIARDEWQLPIRENPIRQIRFKAETNRRERRLTQGELDRIISSAQQCRNRLVLPIILFALETALRRSEILAAKWARISRDSF
jgi:integrase